MLAASRVDAAPPVSLFIGFILPVIMVGFPGIQKIQFENNKVVIERNAERLAQHPSDENARQAIETAVQNVEQRVGDTAAAPDTLEVLANQTIPITSVTGRSWGRIDLSNIIAAVSSRPNLSARTHLAVSEAAVALGHTNQARTNLLQAMSINTNLVVRPQLRQIIRLHP